MYIFYGVEKVHYGVRKLGMKSALKSPVSLISDVLQGKMTAWLIFKGFEVEGLIMKFSSICRTGRKHGRNGGPRQRSGNLDPS